MQAWFPTGEPIHGRGPARQPLSPLAFPSRGWATFPMLGTVPHTLGDISKCLTSEMSEILLPMFSSRIFIVLWIIFESFIYFEFILVYDVNWWSSFIFHIYLSNFSNTMYWRECLYSMACSCLLCQILIDHIGSMLCSVDLHACSYASIRLFWLQRTCSIVWYQILWIPPTLFSFLKIAEAIWGLFWFYKFLQYLF